MNATLYFRERILTGAVVLKCFALEILLHYLKLLKTPKSFCLAYISINYITNWKREIWKRMGCSEEIGFILQFLHISLMLTLIGREVLYCFVNLLNVWLYGKWLASRICFCIPPVAKCSWLQYLKKSGFTLATSVF